jgi:hypothetical protein
MVIASRLGVKRVLNEAKRHPAKPVLIPNHPWEGVDVYLYGTVLYDEGEKVFKMWYTSWGAKSNISLLAGKPVCFRFVMKDADVYSMPAN